MIENVGTFAARFEQLRGGMSYQTLSDAVHRKSGIRISPQAMHLWSKGGEISEENLAVLAEFFGVSKAWLRYGEGDLEDALVQLPEESRQQVFDFIRYKIERADTQIASQSLPDYLAMIDRIKDDMNKRTKRK